ncbi:MAG: class I SAM-dependent methyltransferase [Chloroflexi bacterium]|nr:class I SAM-dependent methyltransferase [Chloroflexota bacterium]
MLNTYSPTWFTTFMDTIAPTQTQAEVEFLGRQLPQPQYSTVLDVCCGSGRHSRLLAAQGYRVTGIDVNVPSLEKARTESDNRVTFIEHDMRAIDKLSGPFDAVINLWQSFGHFDEATNADIIRQIAHKLNPKGRFVLDIYFRAFFEKYQGERTVERNGIVITENKTMHGNHLIVRLDYPNDYDEFEWQLFTPDEISQLAERFGLQGVVACSGYDETRTPSLNNPRMQLVFEKSPWACHSERSERFASRST